MQTKMLYKNQKRFLVKKLQINSEFLFCNTIVKNVKCHLTHDNEIFIIM